MLLPDLDHHILREAGNLLPAISFGDGLFGVDVHFCSELGKLVRLVIAAYVCLAGRAFSYSLGPLELHPLIIEMRGDPLDKKVVGRRVVYKLRIFCQMW